MFSKTSASTQSLSLIQTLSVKNLGLLDYATSWQAMQDFTDNRDDNTPDELWLLQHPPVFTQGQAGRAEHLLVPGDIPVVQADRGGQVTYHGPGQLVAYPLLNLRRRKMGVRDLVTALEDTLVATLAYYQIQAYAKADAPGVYVDRELATGALRCDKIASLGLRVRRGCSFHGLALNIDMDLSPFERINPCGYQDLKMTQLTQCSQLSPSVEAVAGQLLKNFTQRLGYGHYRFLGR